MAPTRERDENGTPILITSSPSTPRASRRPKRQRQSSGLTGCPTLAPGLQALKVERTGLWVRGGKLSKDSSKFTIADVRALSGGLLGEAGALQEIANIAKPSEAAEQTDIAKQSGAAKPSEATEQADVAKQSANVGSLAKPRDAAKQIDSARRRSDAVLTGRVAKRDRLDVYGE